MVVVILKVHSILDVFAVLNNSLLCALYLLPVLILISFFCNLYILNEYNPIVTYNNVSEGQLKYNITKVKILEEGYVKMPIVQPIF